MKHKKMSAEDTLRISIRLLSVISPLIREFPIVLATPVASGECEKLFNIVLNGKKTKVTRQYLPVGDEVKKSPSYRLVKNDVCYEIAFYDRPEIYGYSSSLKKYDEETYVFCTIIEKRHTGKTKFVIAFGFDVVKMKFLELFCISHFPNVENLIREPDRPSFLKVQKFLKGFYL